jgi:hypothetical protein
MLVSTPNESDGFSSTFASSFGSANIVNEGNSTFMNSKQDATGQQNVSTVIIIPNPNSNPNSNKSLNESSSAVNESKQLNPNLKNSILQNNKNVPVPSNSTDMDEMKNQQKSTNSFNNASLQHEMQRGEYLVDNNGIHYYKIDNCSLVNGSSGIGDLSECEDAEREIQEELTG